MDDSSDRATGHCTGETRGDARGAAPWAALRVPMVVPHEWTLHELTCGVRELERVRREVDAASAVLVGAMPETRDSGAALARSCGVSGREAKRRRDVAAVARKIPRALELLASGKISAEHVLALVPVASLPGASGLLEGAASKSPEELIAAAEDFRLAGEHGEDVARKQRARRMLRFFNAPGGMIGLSGLLPPLEGATLKARLAAIVDARWRTEHPERASTLGGHGGDTRDQRMADALLEITGVAEAPVTAPSDMRGDDVEPGSMPDNSAERATSSTSSDAEKAAPSATGAETDPPGNAAAGNDARADHVDAERRSDGPVGDGPDRDGQDREGRIDHHADAKMPNRKCVRDDDGGSDDGGSDDGGSDDGGSEYVRGNDGRNEDGRNEDGRNEDGRNEDGADQTAKSHAGGGQIRRENSGGGPGDAAGVGASVVIGGDPALPSLWRPPTEVRTGKPAVIVVFDVDSWKAELLGHGPIPVTASLFDLVKSDLYYSFTTMTGEVLKFGQARRDPTAVQRLAVIARDRHCIYPGCHAPPEHCEIHHVDEVLLDNGVTDVEKLGLVCKPHHRHVHLLGLYLQREADGSITVRRRDTGEPVTRPPNAQDAAA